MKVKNATESDRNKTLYVAEFSFGTYPSRVPGLITFLTMDSWTLMASTDCLEDCDCDLTCYDVGKSSTFKNVSEQTQVHVSDNPANYKGYDGTDRVCFLD